jgi:hypothetical protein
MVLVAQEIKTEPTVMVVAGRARLPYLVRQEMEETVTPLGVLQLAMVLAAVVVAGMLLVEMVLPVLWLSPTGVQNNGNCGII